jgi:hypothetical protein
MEGNDSGEEEGQEGQAAQEPLQDREELHRQQDRETGHALLQHIQPGLWAQ